MSKIELSRRQQNRIDALRDIHRAAFDLTVAGNSPSVTVEAISKRAGVSPRTFFNYYRSKEDAILGLQPPTVREEQLDALSGHGSEGLLIRVLMLLRDVIKDSIMPVGDMADKTDLAEFPKLLDLLPDARQRLRAHMVACENAAQVAVVAKLESNAFADVELDNMPDAEESARALIVLAGAILRFTYYHKPTEIFSSAPSRLEASVQIFKKVLKETL